MRYFATFILIIWESNKIFCGVYANVIYKSLVTQISRLGQIRSSQVYCSEITHDFINLTYHSIPQRT